MNAEYSVGEVRDIADKQRATMPYTAKLLTDYADLLERIKADESAVTDAVVQRAVQAFAESLLAQRESGGSAHHKDMRTALLAVWPNPPARTDEVACYRFVGPTGEVVTEWEDGLPDNGKRFPDLCPPVSSVQYAYFHSAPPASPAGVPDSTVLYTVEEVAEAQETLRKHNRTLMGEVIDQMIDVLLAAAPSAPAIDAPDSKR